MGRPATAFGVLLVFALLAVVVFFVVKASGSSPPKANGIAATEAKKGGGAQAPQERPRSPDRNGTGSGGGGGSRIRQKGDAKPGSAPPRTVEAPRTDSISIQEPRRTPPPDRSGEAPGATGGGQVERPVSPPAPQAPSVIVGLPELRKEPAVVPQPEERRGGEPKVELPKLQPVERPAPPAPKEEEKPQFYAYVVKSGDCLWNLALTHYSDGSKYREILKANPEIKGEGSNLKVGQRIRIPIIERRQAVEETPKDARLHTIRSGDTIWGIAKESYGDASLSVTKEILAANPGLDPDALAVGKRIRLPTLPGKGPR